MADRVGLWQRVRGWFSRADGDIETPKPETIKPLNPDSIGADLDRLCEIVQRKAYAAIDWYVAARRSKKRAAWWIRRSD